MKACDPPAAIAAEVGDSVRWSSGPAATPIEAVPVFPAYVPLTVCPPATEAVHVFPEQEPSGAIEKLATEVRSPSEFSYWSRPSASNDSDAPAAIEVVSGLRTMWSSAAGVTNSVALLVLPSRSAVTV